MLIRDRCEAVALCVEPDEALPYRIIQVFGDIGPLEIEGLRDLVGGQLLFPEQGHDLADLELADDHVVEQPGEGLAFEKGAVFFHRLEVDAELFPLDQANVGNQSGQRLKSELQGVKVQSLADPKGPQGLGRFREIVHDLGVAHALGGADPFDAQPLGVQADMGQQFAAQVHEEQRFVVPLGQVVALPRPAAADEHAVHAIFKGAQQEGQVHPAGTHETNDLDIRCILLSGNSSQVRSGISSPVA
ncbi:hypothetical protein DESC_100028 [Desulfosarcina cetonica]|nr:hypothetical protein DESC_100028 [Desulfosarcina cetonica]